MADVITRFKLETTQFDSKLRDSAKSLADLTGKLMIAGKDFDRFASKNVEAAKALGNIAPSATNAKDKVKELVTAYNDVAKAYNKLTVEQKNTDYGKALAGSLAELKGRVKDAKQELYGLGDSMDKVKDAGVDFNSVLSSLGQRFGINSELMGALTSGTLATTAAVTAGAAAVVAATKMWADYNDELNRQTNVTTVTTGLKGDDADNLTIGVRALARTYDVDFREAINAANTLIQQFGVSGEQALSLLQDGMQGMIAGDGGKLLSMIQQYAPSFRDAGIEASQLVAIIQNSEGGIFTDQNMNAIVMGIRNIRLMTKQTSDALAQLGIDGEDMSRKLEDGSMTIFEALRQVSGAIDNVGSGSQAAGEVMQSVFGRQGTMAGTKLGEAIATLNTNLEETKTQTGELGESFVRLNDANIRLENTMKEVFGMTGWEDMSNLIKTDLANTLSDVLEIVGGIRDAIKEIGTLDGFETLAKTIDKATGGLLKANGQLKDIQNTIAFIKGLTGGGSGGGLSEGNGQIGGGVAGLLPSGKSKGSKVTTDKNGKVIGATRDGQDVLAEYLATVNKNAPKPTTTTTPTSRTPSVTKKETWKPIEMADLTLGTQKVNDNSDFLFGRSKQDVQQDLQRAQKAYDIAPDEWTRAEARKDVTRYQKELETMNGEGDLTKGLMKDAYTHDFGKDMDVLAKELKNEQKTTQLSESEQVKQMSAMVGGIQQMVGGISQLGIEIPEGFQSLLSGLQGVMTILQAIQTINTVGHVLGLFRNGGIVPHAATGLMVPGNDFSDSTPVMVSSGELILNKAQQNAVAQGLREERGGGYDGIPYVDGEKIYLGMNNFLRRSGRGEIVTSRR